MPAARARRADAVTGFDVVRSALWTVSVWTSTTTVHRRMVGLWRYVQQTLHLRMMGIIDACAGQGGRGRSVDTPGEDAHADAGT
jgi:hypothetical protein